MIAHGFGNHALPRPKMLPQHELNEADRIIGIGVALLSCGFSRFPPRQFGANVPR
jgi:hypothetical protein